MELPPGEFDVVDVTGQANLGGTLEVDLVNGFLPSFGDRFDFLTASLVLNTFDTELLPALTCGLFWLVDYQTDGVSLLVSKSAGFDQDGNVDGADLTKWSSDFGGAGSDADGDGDSDGADFLAWQRQFTGDLSSPLSAATVPEPSSIVLLLGLIALNPVRAKRSH